MCTAALLIIAKGGSHPDIHQQKTDRHKHGYIHRVACYSASERKDIVTQATTWMNLEDIVLSEISQAQQDKCYLIPLI